MKKKYVFIVAILIIMATTAILIGCGGSDSGTSGGSVSPTSSPTQTSTPYSNKYRVYASDSLKDNGAKLIIMPIAVSTPAGYFPAGGAYLRFIDSNNLLQTRQVDSNGEFDAAAFGIPGVSPTGDLSNIATVDITYNGFEETNVPVPVINGNMLPDPGQIKFIKIIPAAGLIKEGSEMPFLCLGIGDNGVLPMKNVSWSVSDESIIRIKEQTEDGSICIVEGVSGGVLPELALAYLTATAGGVVPPSPPTETPVPEPTLLSRMQQGDPLTDTARVWVIKPPQSDAKVTGTLLDKDGNPVPNARMVFRAKNIPIPLPTITPMPLYPDQAPVGCVAFPAYTDEQGKFTANLMSGLSYSVLAMVENPEPIPTPSVTIFPQPTLLDSPNACIPARTLITPPKKQIPPLPGFMLIFRTTPDPFGPVAPGETTQDFTLSDQIGPPTPHPTPTHPWPTPTHPWPTPTCTPPCPTPTHPWPTPTCTFPFPTPTHPWPTPTIIVSSLPPSPLPGQ